MSSTENERLIKTLKTYLVCAGAWNRPLANPKTNKLYKVFSIIPRINLVNFCLLCLMEFVRLIVQGYDTEIITSSLVVVINTFKIAMTMGIYLKNGVLDLFDEVTRKEGDVWACDDVEVKAFYTKKIKVCNNFTIAHAVNTFVAAFALHATGLVGNIKLLQHNQMYNDTLESHHGLQYWFPVNKLDNIYWYYVMQVVLGWSAFFYNCVAHMVITALMIFQALHLEILQIRLRKFISSDVSSFTMDDKVMELKGLIREHQYLITFAQRLNESVKNIIFMEYILSSLDIASAVTGLTKMQELRDLSLQFIYIILLSVQTFILAWTSNEIKIQSEGIADAVFESDWFLLNKDGNRLLQFMVARAQNPLVMNIGPFGPMTTQSALVIIRAAYSYVSIMRK